MEGDAGDVPEPGAGSGRPGAMLWHGVVCKELTLLVK